jgi:septal ring factor EnvC (AmiA/AmiB activator)
LTYFLIPDNELDKTQTRLEVAEKKFKEKSKALTEAKEEAIQLKKQIQIKEERLKKVNEQFSSQNGTLTISSSR